MTVLDPCTIVGEPRIGQELRHTQYVFNEPLELETISGGSSHMAGEWNNAHLSLVSSTDHNKTIFAGEDLVGHDGWVRGAVPACLLPCN